MSHDMLDFLKYTLESHTSIHHIVLLFKMFSGNNLIFKKNLKDLINHYCLYSQSSILTTMNTEMSNFIPREEKNFIMPTCIQ